MEVAHKGSISMGLVLIPIGMYKATVDNDIHFNQLEKESKARIKYKKYCSHCGKEVTSTDIVKGYEYEKDKYVVMSDDELEKIKTKKDKTIHILHFAKMSEVNMIYYEKDYYAAPDTGAEKAYELLRQALLSQKKVAIAKTVMGTNEKLLVLYPTKDGIIVKTLFYYDEIAAMPNVLLTAYAVRGLDINTSYTIYNLLTEQKMKGVAVVYIGEELDVLLELCDRILVLCGGEVSGIVDARNTTKEEIGLMMTSIGSKEAK